MDTVRVEVHDARHGFGRRALDSIGLRLVEAFSFSWGITRIANDGKAMWAVVQA
jgi:hypothetical protein